ncbi:MAG: hypothetical protein KDD41_02860 [Flavobacteriales bacterium]|nr:hypothetical protein [Flavobacteriales bacterium]
MKILAILIALLGLRPLFAQGYQYQADVEQPQETGFCQVQLDPSITTKLNASFSDLRLRNGKGVEQPYILEKEAFSVHKRVFKTYRLVEKKRWRNGATVLYVENEAKDMINNIQLQIRNFDVRKRLELAGSDDYEDWYAIKENYVFWSANGKDTTSEAKGLYFPYSDYRYYRIIIYDVYSMPINVLQVGYFDTYREQGKFSKIDNPELYRIDSNEVKETYIKLKFNGNPYFDKLTFKVDKPEFYYRKARLALKQKDYKGRTYYQTITRFVLHSNSELTLFETAFPHQEFYLIVENEDNPPLEGLNIEAYQLNHRLISYFETGENYTLVFGSDSVLPVPNYDLQFFRDKIGKQVPVLSVRRIRPFAEAESKKGSPADTTVLWIVVAVVALLLGLISYKMITEMEKK